MLYVIAWDAEIKQETEHDMKSSTRDKVEGAIHQVKGEIKKGIGMLAGDASLKSEGTAEKAAGKVQAKRGDIKKVFNK